MVASHRARAATAFLALGMHCEPEKRRARDREISGARPGPVSTYLAVDRGRGRRGFAALGLFAVAAVGNGCFTLCTGQVEKIYKDTNVVSAPIILCLDLAFGVVLCPLVAVTGQLGKPPGTMPTPTQSPNVAQPQVGADAPASSASAEAAPDRDPNCIYSRDGVLIKCSKQVGEPVPPEPQGKEKERARRGEELAT